VMPDFLNAWSMGLRRSSNRHNSTEYHDNNGIVNHILACGTLRESQNISPLLAFLDTHALKSDGNAQYILLPGVPF